MDEATVPATRLVERLAARDLDGFVAVLAPDARLRYLVPPGPGEVSGADEVGEKLWHWFGGAVSVGVLDVQVEPLPDRVSARYRFLLEQRDGWEVVEQQMYVDADEDGLIAGIDLLCSGFRPTAGPEEGGLLATHRFDAGALGCADGLAREFRRRILAIPPGDRLENGGQVWLCGACTKPRGITEEQLGKGATIVGAAKVVEEVVAGAKTVAFAG